MQVLAAGLRPVRMGERLGVAMGVGGGGVVGVAMGVGVGGGVGVDAATNVGVGGRVGVVSVRPHPREANIQSKNAIDENLTCRTAALYQTASTAAIKVLDHTGLIHICTLTAA